jgi:hypothetical protein
VDYRDRTQDILAGRLLDVIRETPALYLGELSLTGLWHFLHGYHEAELVNGIKAVRQIPNDFHDWVAYRLHYFESTSGWRRMILGQVPDEAAAFKRFFELLDDHRTRKARIVATLDGRQFKDGASGPAGGTPDIKWKEIPQRLELVSYTEDPGLFLTAEDDFPEKGSLTLPFLWSRKIEKSAAILDHQAFDRWLEFIRASHARLPSQAQ